MLEDDQLNYESILEDLSNTYENDFLDKRIEYINQLEFDRRNLTIQIENLQNQQENAEQLHTKLKNQLIFFQDESSRMKSLQEECDRCMENFEQQNDTIYKLRSTIAKLNADQQFLKDDLSKEENKCSELEKMQTSLRNTIEMQLNYLEDVKEQENSNLETIADLNEKINKLFSKLEKLEGDYISLQYVLKNAQDESECMSTENEELRLQIKWLHELQVQARSDIGAKEDGKFHISNPSLCDNDGYNIVENDKSISEELNCALQLESKETRGTFFMAKHTLTETTRPIETFTTMQTHRKFALQYIANFTKIILRKWIMKERIETKRMDCANILRWSKIPDLSIIFLIIFFLIGYLFLKRCPCPLSYHRVSIGHTFMPTYPFNIMSGWIFKISPSIKIPPQ